MPRVKAPPVRRVPFTVDHRAPTGPARPLDVNYTRPPGERVPARPTDTHNFRRSPATQPAHLASAVRGWLHDDFADVHALRIGGTTRARTQPGNAAAARAHAQSLNSAISQYYRNMAPRGRVNGVGAGSYLYRGMLKPVTRRWRVGTYTSFSRNKTTAIEFARSTSTSDNRRSARRQGIVLRLRASDVPRSISFGTAQIPDLRSRLPGVSYDITRNEAEVLLPPGVFVLKGPVGRVPGTRIYMYDAGFAASRSATSSNGGIQMYGTPRRLHLSMFRRSG